MIDAFCEVPFAYSSEPSQPCAVHLWVHSQNLFGFVSSHETSFREIAFVKGREDEKV